MPCTSTSLIENSDEPSTARPAIDEGQRRDDHDERPAQPLAPGGALDGDAPVAQPRLDADRARGVGEADRGAGRRWPASSMNTVPSGTSVRSAATPRDRCAARRGGEQRVAGREVHRVGRVVRCVDDGSCGRCPPAVASSAPLCDVVASGPASTSTVTSTAASTSTSAARRAEPRPRPQPRLGVDRPASLSTSASTRSSFDRPRPRPGRSTSTATSRSGRGGAGAGVGSVGASSSSTSGLSRSILRSVLVSRSSAENALSSSSRTSGDGSVVDRARRGAATSTARRRRRRRRLAPAHGASSNPTRRTSLRSRNPVLRRRRAPGTSSMTARTSAAVAALGRLDEVGVLLRHPRRADAQAHAARARRRGCRR